MCLKWYFIVILSCVFWFESIFQTFMVSFLLNIFLSIIFSSVQSLMHVQLFATPWTAARQASLSITNSWSLLKLKSIESMMPSNYLILCCPLLLLPSIFPSIRVFANESVLRIQWPKYWSFSFNISPSNEYSGLISFRMDWLDLLAVQGAIKSLLQHHSSKASILQRSAFFIVQLSHPYMTTGKTIALTRWDYIYRGWDGWMASPTQWTWVWVDSRSWWWTGRPGVLQFMGSQRVEHDWATELNWLDGFVGKVMSLLFNMLSRLVITFLPRSKSLLISWLQLPSAVIWEPK